MTHLRRTALALVVTALLLAFGGALHGVATVQATLEPGSPAAEAAERLEQRQLRRDQRMTTADCPWLAPDTAGSTS